MIAEGICSLDLERDHTQGAAIGCLKVDISGVSPAQVDLVTELVISVRRRFCNTVKYPHSPRRYIHHTGVPCRRHLAR
jgi:hypothetical protein